MILVSALAVLLGVLRPARAQVSPIASPLPRSLNAACAGHGVRIGAFMIDYAARHSPNIAERARLHPDERAALRLLETHYRPYRDPHRASTWSGRFSFAIVPRRVPVRVAPDSAFSRWERAGYALALNWTDPPIVRQHTLQPFQPRLAEGPTLIYPDDALHAALDAFLLPLGATPTPEIERRIGCIRRVAGLTDWARTSNDLHSPPAPTVLLNASRTRAIVGFGWGRRGGVWILYQRAPLDGTWTKVRPIGAWQFELSPD